MRLALSVLLLCTIAAPSARAGAWLRAPGDAFVSVTSTLRQLGDGRQSETSLFAEYGLARRLTLGMDVNDIPGLAGHVLMFARIPVGSSERRTKIALQAGLGGHRRLDRWAGMAKTTLSVGRGFSGRWGDGWFNVDAGVEMRLPDPDPTFKLDATIGLSSGGRVRPLLQVESAYLPGNTTIWSLVPGIMIDGRNDTTWVLGLERKTARQTSLGLKFGLWRQF